MTIEVMDRALREASEELGVNPYTYENHADFEYGHRERIYLDQLEVVARVLEVSVSDLLDDSTRTHEWESGRKAGVRMAVAKMYSTLHGLGDG
jgi:DNA-binding Xre family transcriptional regulator